MKTSLALMEIKLCAPRDYVLVFSDYAQYLPTYVPMFHNELQFCCSIHIWEKIKDIKFLRGSRWIVGNINLK